MSSLACCKGDIDKAIPQGRIETIAGHNVYVAKPASFNPNSSIKLVVIATDIFGYTLANPRLVADKYAAKGYLCLVPDLFKGTEASASMMAAADDMSSEKSGFGSKILGFGSVLWNMSGFLLRNNAAGGCKIVEDVITEARSKYSLTNVYLQGYCWGGTIGIKLAQKVGVVDAVVAAHPGPISFPTDIQNLVTPIFFALAEKDDFVKEKHWAEMRALLAKKEGFKYSLEIFEKTDHGFAVRGSETDEFVNMQRQKAFDAAVAFFESV
ncbi:alpha/beta-hydrolase [Rhizoclosmatium globosum]|uniref:Alpha/beta-hydrolase n=1 Tax=Rhizoclosmatium globosum TaxID=329046 RepID=A0A1Y2CPH1_9FUNG|nr:alpha/beta-hydrolase [Rhizoclosmatium globosum]|eukprot:ORY48902.1 alpha/beta-hydrolase [Rhizoclosmatium globosum]